MLSPADRNRLENLRLDRLRQQLPILRPPMALHISPGNTLEIFPLVAAEVDVLLLIEDDLRARVWLTLGCDRLSIWFCNEEVWEGSTLPLLEELPEELSEELESLTEAFLEETNMVATAERTAIDPADIIDRETTAAITPVIQGLVDNRMQAFVKSDAFADLVRSEALNWVEQAIVAPLRQLSLAETNGNGAVIDAAIVDVQPLAVGAPEPQPATLDSIDRQITISEAEALPEQETELKMLLPSGIKSKLTSSTRANLEQALPEDPADRRTYLEEIVNQTESGKKWLADLIGQVEKAIGVSKTQPYSITYLNMVKRMLKATGTSEK